MALLGGTPVFGGMGLFVYFYFQARRAMTRVTHGVCLFATKSNRPSTSTMPGASRQRLSGRYTRYRVIRSPSQRVARRGPSKQQQRRARASSCRAPSRPRGWWRRRRRRRRRRVESARRATAGGSALDDGDERRRERAGGGGGGSGGVGRGGGNGRPRARGLCHTARCLAVPAADLARALSLLLFVLFFLRFCHASLLLSPVFLPSLRRSRARARAHARMSCATPHSLRRARRRALSSSSRSRLARRHVLEPALVAYSTTAPFLLGLLGLSCVSCVFFLDRPPTLGDAA